MGSTLRNQRGLAIIYGLIVLMIASVAGTAVLFITRKNRSNATDYGQIRIVSQAAHAALKACEGQFMNDPATSLDILKKFRADPDEKWLLGGVDETGSENRLTLGDQADAADYSATITGFDQDNQLLKVEGLGYGKHGGKTHVSAIYQLGGLAMVTPPPAKPGRFAIYIANDAENFNRPAIINGDVYFGDKVRTQNANGTVINGNVKTAAIADVSEILNSITINGNAYFRMPVKFNNAQSTINGKAGFDANVDFTKSPYALSVGDEAFFNSTVNAGSATASVNMNGNKVTRNVAINESYIYNASSIENNGGQIDIAAEMEMCEGDEEPITFDISSINNSVTYETVFGGQWNSWSCATLNSYYDNNPGKLWNGYLVIKVNNQIGIWNHIDGTFTKKVIWIFNITTNPTIQLDNWYTSSPNSVTLIYSTGSTYFNTLKWSGLFRGFIYTTGNAKVQYKFEGQQLHGAMIHTASYGGDHTFEITGNSNCTITYDDEVDAMLDEFVSLGIATRPTVCSGGGGSGTAELKLVDIKIRPKLLGIQM